MEERGNKRRKEGGSQASKPFPLNMQHFKGPPHSALTPCGGLQLTSLQGSTQLYSPALTLVGSFSSVAP